MLKIGLHEGLSNAVKYREPGSEIVLRAALEEKQQEYEERTLLTLHIELDNVSCAGVAPLSSQACSHRLGLHPPRPAPTP